MSAIKEPNFFLFDADGEAFINEQPIIRKSVKRRPEYEALFHPTAETSAIGDASPLYLYTRPAAQRIVEVCGVLRVVCVLRRPAERAWSHFLFAFEGSSAERSGHFAELIDAEMAGGSEYEPYRTPTHLVRLGRYAGQIRHYRETFGDENVLVLLTDDLSDRPAEVLADVSRFIAVDPTFEFTLEHRYNTSGAPPARRLPVLRRGLRRLQPRIKALLPPRLAGRLAEAKVRRSDSGVAPPPPLDDAIADRIADWCKEDVKELAELIGRDLDEWIERPVT